MKAAAYTVSVSVRILVSAVSAVSARFQADWQSIRNSGIARISAAPIPFVTRWADTADTAEANI